MHGNGADGAISEMERMFIASIWLLFFFTTLSNKKRKCHNLMNIYYYKEQLQMPGVL